MNIFQKINSVQKAVKYVQKDAQISGGGSYKAVTHDQVISVIRKSLVDNGIVIYPEQLKGDIKHTTKTKSGSDMYLYAASYAIHFVNMDDSSDRVSVTIESHAMDNGDKAPGKAITYATKAAILKVFCLETGENDESRTASHEPYSEVQLEKFEELVAAGNPVQYLEFLNSLTDQAKIALYNSGEKGKKIELKKKCSALEEEAHNIFADYKNQISQAIQSEDKNAVYELVDELTPFEKRMVAGRLTSEEVEWIKVNRED